MIPQKGHRSRGRSELLPQVSRNLEGESALRWRRVQKVNAAPRSDFIKGHFEKRATSFLWKFPFLSESQTPHMWEKLLSKLKDKVGILTAPSTAFSHDQHRQD